jgi:hypothetical protein
MTLSRSAHRETPLALRRSHQQKFSKVLIRFTLIAFVVTQSIQLSNIVPDPTASSPPSRRLPQPFWLLAPGFSNIS